ncbi:hypothetical protein [Spiroplasma endosymbiont of Sarcophaga carnaria]|uniref:hypothetical protein n=1 Tax=Spiroplasma endosymbiont of Sarcophaga carnaria TaxID=3066303 RepID=UPI0030D21F17
MIFFISSRVFDKIKEDFDIGCGIVVSSSKGVSGWYIDTNGLISSFENIKIGNLKIKRKLVS